MTELHLLDKLRQWIALTWVCVCLSTVGLFAAFSWSLADELSISRKVLNQATATQEKIDTSLFAQLPMIETRLGELQIDLRRYAQALVPDLDYRLSLAAELESVRGSLGRLDGKLRHLRQLHDQ